MTMKLAAYLLFWDQEPILEASTKHAALLGQEFVPDVMALDDAGKIFLWIECGKVTMHKVNKLIRRFTHHRMIRAGLLVRVTLIDLLGLTESRISRVLDDDMQLELPF